MRRIAVIVAALVILSVAAVAAQDAASELHGKVYLRGGETYEGVIQTAEWGVVDGAGIGANRTYMAVKVNGELVKVPITDIATIEADWQQAGPEGAKKWQIASLAITKKDGTKVSGGVDWLLHESAVDVLQADGTIVRHHAFPIANPEFDASQLLAKVELGSAVTPGGGTAPAGGGTTPAGGGTAPAGGGTAPAGGGTAPAGGGTAPAGGGTAPAGGGTAPLTGPPGPGGTPAVMTITIICPHCGEKITVELPVIARPGG